MEISNITQRYIQNENMPAYKLPMLHVNLIHKKRELETYALVDSGSTSTFVPKELARLLDVDLTRKQYGVRGAGGDFYSTPTIIGRCQLIKEQRTVYEEFQNMHIMVPIESNILPCMVLGRDYVFKSFKITFNENEQKIVLRRTKVVPTPGI